ncbi:MAG: VCBS repeat-containing protein [Verrucomicrobia bacterium]|nr:VCBS repeat-containing protein [Verrucomicrobiota bacterium]
MNINLVRIFYIGGFLSFLAILVVGLPIFAASALTWEQRAGHRVAELPVPKQGRTGFTLLDVARTGIQFTNTLSPARAMENQNLMNGAGVAAGDFDGDGLADLFFCNIEGRCALYRNLGNFKFADVTETAGVACTNQYSTGAVFADVNGDGLLDLLVTSNGGPNACFLNEGNGHFKNVTAEAGLVQMRAGGTTMALADVNGDGFLDLYVANYGEVTILRGGGTYSVTYRNGKPEVAGRYRNRLKIDEEGNLIELGYPDALYLNDSKGRFKPVSWSDGTFLDEDGVPLKGPPWDMGLSVTFRDINDDGFPDIYVCNDFHMPDRLWLNDGQGHFRAAPRFTTRTMSRFAMGVDFADINRDGLLDFIVVDMLSRDHRLLKSQMGITNPVPTVIGEINNLPQIRHNTLFLNRGDGTYAEIANFAGVDASDWSWCPVFLDVDLDGFEDLLVSNGHARDIIDFDTMDRQKLLGRQSLEDSRTNLFMFPLLQTPNVAFHNRRDLTFEETGAAWAFNSKQVSHGIALVDLDNDGDQDVVVNCLNAPPLIYRNETAAPRIAVRLKGKPGNVQGIGGKIKVTGGAVPMQSQEIVSGGRYLSGDDPMRVFAAGSSTNKLTIEVAWRSCTRSVVTGVLANHLYEIDEAGATATEPKPPLAAPKPLFEDISERINHKHAEEPFDDFALQRLLPKRLSQLGPGVAWFDLDGDGHDELILGSGKGGSLAIYRSDGRGKFERWRDPAFDEPAQRDQTSVLGWTPHGGTNALLVGLSNYEDGTTNGAAVQRFDFSGQKILPGENVPDIPSSTGPLAIADIDGDGDLDVFVGGRVIPGRYPVAAASRLFRNDAGKLILDTANQAAFANVGLVSGAVFSDLDGDGLPELILACEWGPIRVFQNSAGSFREITRELGLEKFTGWWSGVTTGDLDGDGRLDIVAGNWGLNSPYHATEANPIRIYYGDFNEDGATELIEADTVPETGKIAPRRDLLRLGTVLPFLRAQYPTHKSFGDATIADMLGKRFATTSQVQANTLESMLFLNRSNRFVAVPLPREAQFAPAFAAAIADLDGDGNEDVFLSQNFFATQPDLPRLDAGRGLCLRGDGRGGLTPMAGSESGVKIYGEQRGAALGDFDEDGRVDLAVTQNGTATKLYHNAGAKPGLRIRLVGSANNPHGIGAVVRLKSDERWGPAREIHGGSGYWSQDSTVPVMTMPGELTAVWVRWPGGKTTTSKLELGASEVSIDANGKLERAR